MDIDDILGHQQDEIAKGRYTLAKGMEGSKDFQGCRTPFDFLCRHYDLIGDGAVTTFLANFARSLNAPTLNTSSWVTPLLNAVKAKDAKAFDRIITSESFSKG